MILRLRLKHGRAVEDYSCFPDAQEVVASARARFVVASGPRVDEGGYTYVDLVEELRENLSDAVCRAPLIGRFSYKGLKRMARSAIAAVSTSFPPSGPNRRPPPRNNFHRSQRVGRPKAAILPRLLGAGTLTTIHNARPPP